VQLFTIVFSHPLEFGIASALAVIVVLLAFRAMKTSEGPSAQARRFRRPSAKALWGLIFVVWALFFGILLQLVPHIGASSPYGAIGFVALISGVFVMGGVLWAVIGD
jgi:hypothetical protein